MPRPADILDHSVMHIAGEQRLKIMRPYQVYAVQHMVKCMDDDNGNGFIWHTTGSGKTLTSFNASTLLKENDHIHKCVFVVDRKDLDRQTREDWSSSDKTLSKRKARRVSARSANQFNRFQEGYVEKNTSTAALSPALGGLRGKDDRLHYPEARPRQ